MVSFPQYGVFPFEPKEVARVILALFKNLLEGKKEVNCCVCHKKIIESDYTHAPSEWNGRINDRRAGIEGFLD